jgi:hypothetical protein
MGPQTIPVAFLLHVCLPSRLDQIPVPDRIAGEKDNSVAFVQPLEHDAVVIVAVADSDLPEPAASINQRKHSPSAIVANQRVSGDSQGSCGLKNLHGGIDFVAMTKAW